MAGEDQLIQDVIRRRNDAIETLYDRYAPSLLSLCLRYCGNRADAEDVLQEGFLKIIGHLHRFRARHEGSLQAWMRRIMVNTSLNHLRAKARGKIFTGADPGQIPEAEEDAGPDLITELGEHVSTEDVIALIGALPPGYRAVFNLYVFEEYTHKEIAEALGCSENNSKSQLWKARAMLRKNLSELVQKDLTSYEKERPSN